MKIYGLLALFLSVLSVGTTAEGQVLMDSGSQGCRNCSQKVNFAYQPVLSDAVPLNDIQILNQPIYQDASVAPATYMPSNNLSSTTYPAYATSAPYSVSSVRQPISRASTSSFAANVRSGLAQTKAASAARMGLRGHLGGGLGNAKYEGVGWSNQSAQSAIQNCCYWGTRPVSQIGVAQSSDGCWYACVLYQ